MKKFLTFIYLLLQSFSVISYAQSVPVGMPGTEDWYRRAQLLGELDSSISFSIRPFSPSLALKGSIINSVMPDSGISDTANSSSDVLFGNVNESLILTILPLSWKQQFNSAIPYGWNDGAMIPAKGYQTKLSAGAFLKAGPLTFQFQPEYVYAVNSEFDHVDHSTTFIPADLPSRFGEDSYSHFSWGQSSLKLNAGPVSAGISNESLWWGPGNRNSLLMTNNAKGFKHLTVHTNRPVHTPVGSFEAQIIGGKLINSRYNIINSDPFYSDWRYLSSMAINFQPKWVPGLFLGLNRSFQTYNRNLKAFGDYFPFLTPFKKVKDTRNSSGEDSKDQLASVYARWLFNKTFAEVYFEYGFNDHSYNLRDFIMSPEHSRAYIFGFRKLVPLKRKGEYLQVNTEITQLSQSVDRLVREAYDWYTHFQILQGYTNDGEVIGAGTGPGGNLQSIDVSWIKDQKTIGVQFERYVHNNDYYNIVVKDFGEQSRRWVDFGFAAIGTWDYKNLLVNAKLQGIRSLNYQWQMKNFSPGTYYIPENDIFNFHGELGLTYRF